MKSPDPYDTLIVGKHPLQSGCPESRHFVLTDTAYPVCRQDRHFYFFLFSLSLVRKARNATIKLPKVTNSVSIPMKIEIISNAVISRTSLPMYSWQARALAREATACHGCSPRKSFPFRWLIAMFVIISSISQNINQSKLFLVLFHKQRLIISVIIKAKEI